RLAFMARFPSRGLLKFIRHQLAETSADVSDRELLEQFFSEQDENAFKTILKRHGPMVLRVCQRLLRQREDAEDVFQATFLFLARKASSLGWGNTIGPWLCRVAQRLAQNVQRSRIRQQAREARSLRDPSVETALGQISALELVAIIEEEVGNLP